MPHSNLLWHPYTVASTQLERQFAEAVRNVCPGRNPIELLDYGCGYGIRTEKVAEYLRPRRATVYLYDVDPNLITSARHRISKVAAVRMFSASEQRQAVRADPLP